MQERPRMEACNVSQATRSTRLVSRPLPWRQPRSMGFVICLPRAEAEEMRTLAMQRNVDTTRNPRYQASLHAESPGQDRPPMIQKSTILRDTTF